MTTPDGTKSAKFSPEVHAQLMALARELDETMDGALRHVLGMSTIRVEVTEVQRARWTEAADAIGVTVDEFVRLRVESALHYNTTPDALYGIYTGVIELCRAQGLNPPLIQHSTRVGILGSRNLPREPNSP